MEKVTKILTRIIVTVFASILLWTILLGLLDYDTIIYNFNPIIVVLGIVVYISLIRLMYKKVIPKIENNKVIPYIIIRIVYT